MNLFFCFASETKFTLSICCFVVNLRRNKAIWPFGLDINKDDLKIKVDSRLYQTVTEMWSDCSHAGSDCERLHKSSDQTLCRDSKCVLDSVNHSDCMDLCLFLTMETKMTQPGQGRGGSRLYKSFVIMLLVHSLIIHKDSDSLTVHALPTRMLKEV